MIIYFIIWLMQSLDQHPIVSINGYTQDVLYLTNDEILRIDSIGIDNCRSCAISQFHFGWTVFQSTVDVGYVSNSNRLTSEMSELLISNTCYKAYLHDIVVIDSLGNDVPLGKVFKIVPIDNCGNLLYGK